MNKMLHQESEKQTDSNRQKSWKSLLFRVCCEQVNTASETQSDVWHARYGHLGMQSLAKLSSDKLVSGFNYKVSKQKLFCEPWKSLNALYTGRLWWRMALVVNSRC